MSECPTCYGDGVLATRYGDGSPDGGTEECPDCEGTGEVDPEELREAAMYRADEARWQDDRTAYAG